MNIIWEDNLQFLKSQSAGMYEKVRNAEGSSVMPCTAQNGLMNLRKSFMGKELFIHSNYDPLAQSKAISDTVSAEEDDDIIIFFGLGLGYEFRELINKYPGKEYLVVEPDLDIFKTLLENIDLASFTIKKKDFLLVIDDSPEAIIANANALMTKKASTRIRIISLAPYRLMYERLFEQMCTGLQKSVNMFRVNVVTTANFDRQWVLNYVVNTRSLATTWPFEQLRKELQGRPVIIVGAGPSLEYNLDHLRRVYNNAVIAAAGSGISVLNNHGIKAHFAGAMDYSKAEMKIFEHMDLNQDIALLYSSQVYNGVPGMVNGPKFLLNQVPMDIYIAKSLGWEVMSRFSGPSITNVLAYSFAALGCSPIIMLGQDLCYSNDRLYAKGAAYYNDDEISSQDKSLKKVINKNGQAVYTATAFLAMQYSMEQCVKLFPQTEFLNGSKDGLAILGAKDIDFNQYTEEILLQIPAFDIEKMIQDAVSHKPDHTQEQKVRNFIDGMKREIDELKSLSRDCIELVDSDKKPKIKDQQLRAKQREVEANNFYREVIKPSSGGILDMMYKDRTYMDKIKVTSENTLVKCSLMLDVWQQVYSDKSEDEMN